MADIVIGAGTGGMPAANELREKLDKSHLITVVNADQFAEDSQRWRDRVRQRAVGVISLALEIF